MERQILFWVFVGFFVVIGFTSLLAAIGVIKADPSFRKWAVTGFIGAVTAAVIGLFNFIFIVPAQVPLYVTLSIPENVHSPLFLVEGYYQYTERTSSKDGHKQNGTVELTMGQGGWTAKLPERVMEQEQAVELRFKDRDGNWWGTMPFYPNFINRALGGSTPFNQASMPLRSSESFADSAHAAVLHLRFDEMEAQSRTPIPMQVNNAPKFNNYAKSAGEYNGRTFYRWKVFVDEPMEVLGRIAQVEYLLHPTFPNPYQVRSDPNTKFALETTGWGVFQILITVRYKDGEVKKTDYLLSFNKQWPE